MRHRLPGSLVVFEFIVVTLSNQKPDRMNRNIEVPGSMFHIVQVRRNVYRPVFTLVQSRLMMRWVAGSRAVMTNSFASVASSG